MTPIAKQILTVQRKQFTMGLKWISIIEDPLTSKEDRAVAVEQLALVNQGIIEIAVQVSELNTPEICY